MMKTLKEIRDVLEKSILGAEDAIPLSTDSYVFRCFMHDGKSTIKHLDTIIASIPEGLGEVIELHTKAIEMNDHDFAPYVYDLYEAAKLLHSIKGEE